MNKFTVISVHSPNPPLKYPTETIALDRLPIVKCPAIIDFSKWDSNLEGHESHKIYFYQEERRIGYLLDKPLPHSDGFLRGKQKYTMIGDNPSFSSLLSPNPL